MHITDDIKTKIEAAMPNADVMVQDPMNDGAHLVAVVVSEDFEGINRIGRHRKVYAALGNAFSTNLHALQLKTLTPDEFKNLQEQQ